MAAWTCPYVSVRLRDGLSLVDFPGRRGEYSITTGILHPVVTVLIAAAGDDGRAARDLLEAGGFDVEHVTSMAAGRVRAATVDVVVTGALEDATADDLRAALRSAGTETPLVHLGPDDAFETTVERPFDNDRLAQAVRRAERAGEYRRAVDDLYERCRASAEADDDDPADDEAVMAAKRRAERAFRETRRLDDRSPIERLFDPTGDVASTDWPEDEEETDASSTDGQT